LDAVFRFLEKSQTSISLVVLGLAATIWASLRSNTVFHGVDIGLDSPGRYFVLAAGPVLIGFGILFGLIGVGLFRSRTERLPVKKIDINADRRTNPPPHAQHWLSGEVTPKRSGITVWLVREDLGHQPGFSPSPHSARTDNKGYWEQSINMWPGRWRLHAVVTTDQNGSIYRWYHRARKAALDIVQEHNPDTNDVPGWPNLDFLLKPYVSANLRIDV
jgi:hypothetical protein